MVDFNNLLSRFVLAAPRALNDEVAQGQMVVCTQMSIAGSAASFTVKIMNAGTGRDLAEQLAQPLIKGLLGLTASAAELAAATQAEQSVHATKTYTARQTARFYPGWRDWKTAFEQAAAAPRPRTDPPNTGGAGPAAPRPVSILGAPFALEMFRKLPASGSVAAGDVEAAEVLGLCDKMPALGASMLPEAVRIQSFAVALEAAAGEAAHTSLRGEVSAKGQLTLAEATAFLGRFGQAFKRARRRLRRPLPPTTRSSAASTPAGSLMSSWRRPSRLSAPMLRSSELPRAIRRSSSRCFATSCPQGWRRFRRLVSRRSPAAHRWTPARQPSSS